MTLKEKDTIRAQYLDRIADLFKDEDIGKIASNKVNFPAVFNGEEYWLEITVAIPKEDDGYDKREEYQLKLAKAADRAEKKNKKKEKEEKKEAE